jgi:hypothetical protein
MQFQSLLTDDRVLGRFYRNKLFDWMKASALIR